MVHGEEILKRNEKAAVDPPRKIGEPRLGKTWDRAAANQRPSVRQALVQCLICKNRVLRHLQPRLLVNESSRPHASSARMSEIPEAEERTRVQVTFLLLPVCTAAMAMALDVQ